MRAEVKFSIFLRKKQQLLRYIKEKKMVRILKELCKVRDILISNDDKLISNPRNTEGGGLYEKLGFQINDIIKKKYNDREYELDVTSQDFRELAQDIKAVLKRWDDFLDSETNIKTLLKMASEGNFNLDNYLEGSIPVMTARVDSAKALMNLLNIAEFGAVILYMLEIASNDTLALNFTERFEKFI